MEPKPWLGERAEGEGMKKEALSLQHLASLRASTIATQLA